VNDHDKSQSEAQQNQYAQELAELLNLLGTVDRQLIPEHVAQRFHELLDDIGDDESPVPPASVLGGPYAAIGPAQTKLADRIIDHGETLAACRKTEDHNGAAQALTDLASAYLALGNNREILDLARAAALEALAAAAELQTAAKAAAKSERDEILLTTQRLAARLADVLYRVGEVAEAEQVASRALAHATDPDLLVDLHWTLAQCHMRAGRFGESLATLDQVMASPGISAQHRVRLLVLTARVHSNVGETEKAGQVAAAAAAAASEIGDNWAMAWALHVLTIVTAVRGQMAAALPLFDRALAVTQTDPALTDLRLLLQINQAVTLGSLDRHEEAFAAAREARDLAGQVGAVIRSVQAHGALAQLLFDTGQWDDALAEVKALHDDLKEPMAACIDFGIAAVICFHRDDIAEARRRLAAALPYAQRIGKCVIGPLALARSLDREQTGALPEALAELTAGLADGIEELLEIEDLLADATRLASQTGDMDTAKSLADYAAALAAGSDIPHRQATALYCGGLLDHDAVRLRAAAERYGDASRPLPAAAALEAAAAEFARVGDRGQARAAYTRAVEIYISLGAATDVARLQARFRARGIPRVPHAKHRRAGSGRHSIVPAETEIAVPVEVGLSNPRTATKLLLA
jgi:tetratricopeptide (TPR) repeat protein